MVVGWETVSFPHRIHLNAPGKFFVEVSGLLCAIILISRSTVVGSFLANFVKICNDFRKKLVLVVKICRHMNLNL